MSIKDVPRYIFVEKIWSQGPTGKITSKTKLTHMRPGQDYFFTTQFPTNPPPTVFPPGPVGKDTYVRLVPDTIKLQQTDYYTSGGLLETLLAEEHRDLIPANLSTPQMMLIAQSGTPGVGAGRRCTIYFIPSGRKK